MINIDRIDLDPDPTYRKVLKHLNKHGIATTSSCQGHPPGEKHRDIDEWMEPYITFAGGPESQTILAHLQKWGLVANTNTCGCHKLCVRLKRQCWGDVLAAIIEILGPVDDDWNDATDIINSLFEAAYKSAPNHSDTRYAGGVESLYIEVMRRLTNLDCSNEVVEFLRETREYHENNRWDFRPHPDFFKLIKGKGDGLESK